MSDGATSRDTFKHWIWQQSLNIWRRVLITMLKYWVVILPISFALNASFSMRWQNNTKGLLPLAVYVCISCVVLHVQSIYISWIRGLATNVVQVETSLMGYFLNQAYVARLIVDFYLVIFNKWELLKWL